ncbi:MAG: cysteine hydrolase family protein [Pseudorhodoplanes sp.]
MSSRPWDSLISEAEQALYRSGGFEKVAAIRGLPALLLVDVQYRMTGTRPWPLDQAIAEYPTSCGSVAWETLPNIVALQDTFRRLGLPILYVALGSTTSFNRKSTEPARAAGLGVGQFAGTRAGDTISEFDILAEVAPQSDDLVIWKYGPSAFFGTPVASLLIERNIGTVVVAGSSTSGCVRATAVDAFSNRFNVIIPEDAVFDRSPTSHAVSLFDMATRYAGVAPTVQVISMVTDAARSRP